MIKYEILGERRPDSPGTSHRLPTFTLTSFIMATGVEAAILFMKTHTPGFFDLTPMIVLPLAIGGALVSIYSGWYAHVRGESGGGRIAAFGVAVWAVSLCVLR